MGLIQQQIEQIDKEEMSPLLLAYIVENDNQFDCQFLGSGLS